MQLVNHSLDYGDWLTSVVLTTLVTSVPDSGTLVSNFKAAVSALLNLRSLNYVGYGCTSKCSQKADQAVLVSTPSMRGQGCPGIGPPFVLGGLQFSDTLATTVWSWFGTACRSQQNKKASLLRLTFFEESFIPRSAPLLPAC